jgi:glycosyltransferase involved in cell wall biosynthesis
MVRLVAISHAQVRAAPEITWAGVVHNALPVDDYPFRADKDGFVLSLGRLDPSKGAHLAVDAARAAGRRLVLAGKCTEPPERRYFDEAVRPRLGPDVEWLGEVDNATKLELLARASCLLFPLQWEEPFGMVMIEAMACGTPVVALRRGAVPEVVAHGSGGLVCDRADELPAAIEQVGSIDPAACRRLAHERFDVGVMAAGYESLYARCLGA